MNHDDGISRRDAVIGVSFLGVLALAMAATIVYRIADPPSNAPIKAPQLTTFPATEAIASTEPLVVDAAVETASHSEPPPNGPEPNETARPTFVAPAAR